MAHEVLKGAPVSAKAQTEANETGGPCRGKYGPPITKGDFMEFDAEREAGGTVGTAPTAAPAAPAAGAGKPKAGGAADELTPEYMEKFRRALAEGEARRYGS